MALGWWIRSRKSTVELVNRAHQTLTHWSDDLHFPARHAVGLSIQFNLLDHVEHAPSLFACHEPLKYPFQQPDTYRHDQTLFFVRMSLVLFAVLNFKSAHVARQPWPLTRVLVSINPAFGDILFLSHMKLFPSTYPIITRRTHLRWYACG